MEKKQEDRRRAEHEKVQEEGRSSRRKDSRRARGDPSPMLRLIRAWLFPSTAPVTSAVLWSAWCLGPASSSSFYLFFLPPCIPPSLPSFPSPPGIDVAPSKLWDHSSPQGDQKVPTELAGLAHFSVLGHVDSVRPHGL